VRNKFKGVCYRCGKVVEAGDGHFEKLDRSEHSLAVVRQLCLPAGVKWVVQHSSCAIKYRGTTHTYKEERNEVTESHD
jgi:hypothetical protein